MTKPLAKED